MSNNRHSDARQLFVVISTENGIANIPPVLERGRRGDRLVWLESSRARERHWTDRPKKVLGDNGLASEAPIRIPDEPDKIAEIITSRAVRGQLAAEGCKVVLVGNGGTKLTYPALRDSLAEVASTTTNCAGFEVIYGQEEPAELWILQGSGAAAPLQRIAYQKRLKLEQVLTCSGYEILGTEAKLFWPDSHDFEFDFPSLPEARYGEDPEVTAAIHDKSYSYYALKDAHEKLFKEGKNWELPGFDAANLAARGELESFVGQLRRIAQGGVADTDAKALFSQARNILSDFPGLGVAHLAGQGALVGFVDQLKRIAQAGFTDTNAKILFNQAKNVLRETVRSELVKDTLAPDKIGRTFEVAVARRVQECLRTSGGSAAVSEAWFNVKIRRTNSKEKQEFKQMDTVLVLTNGVLIELECKSYKLSNDDLNAGLLNLKRTGSNPAKMFVCVPLYTDFTDRQWFWVHDSLRERLKELKGLFDDIWFTLKGQRPDYEEKKKDRINCPSFEESLDEIIKPYRPETLDKAPCLVLRAERFEIASADAPVTAPPAAQHASAPAGDSKPPGLHKGKITSAKGIAGRVQREDGSELPFDGSHVSAEMRQDLREGTSVTFDIERAKSGKLKAVNLRLDE